MVEQTYPFQSENIINTVPLIVRQSGEGYSGSAAVDAQLNVWFANFQIVHLIRMRQLDGRLGT